MFVFDHIDPKKNIRDALSQLSENILTWWQRACAEWKNIAILLFPTADTRLDTKVKCPTGRAPFWVKFPTWRHHFLKSKTKDPPKFLSSASIRGSIVISVYNFTAQKRASLGNQSILKFRVMEVRDTSLRSNLVKKVYLSHDFEPF